MKAWAGVQLKEHCDDLPVDVVFRHACKLGFEGVMSKRLSSLARLAETDESERTRSEARGTVKPADFLIRLLTALGWL